MMKVKVEIDSHGEYYIVLPDELMEELGWKVGDNVEWVQSESGSYALKKVEE